MEIIADVGGTKGRWVLINKTTKNKIETSGFNPYSHKISSLNHYLDTGENLTEYSQEEMVGRLQQIRQGNQMPPMEGGM